MEKEALKGIALDLLQSGRIFIQDKLAFFVFSLALDNFSTH
jgi:hypothetical protein